MKTSREVGEVEVDGLPLRILDYKLQGAEDVFENVIYKHCAQGDYKNLPAPFDLKSELPVPFLMQIIIIPTKTPENGDPDAQYIDIIKHIYLHKNKLPVHWGMQRCSTQVGLWEALQGGTIGYELHA